MSYVTDHLLDVEDGWHPLLRELHEDLVKIDPDYQTGQVKEKFGALRVYLDGWTGEDTPEGAAIRERLDRMRNVVSGYEVKSLKICEFCGKPGELRTHRHWLKTLCDGCSAERDAGKRPPSWDRWLKEHDK